MTLKTLLCNSPLCHPFESAEPDAFSGWPRSVAPRHDEGGAFTLTTLVMASDQGERGHPGKSRVWNNTWGMTKTLLFCTAAFGLGCNANASPLSSGFYIGIGAGMEHMGGHRSERMNTDPAAFQAQTFTNNQNINKNGPLASVFGGYLQKWGYFGLGGEVFYEAGKVDDSITRNWVQPLPSAFKGYYSATLEKKNGFGFRADIGGVIQDQFFLYVLLGVSATQLRYSSTASLLDPTAPENYQQIPQANRKLAYGVDYGLGLHYQLNQWRLGIEGYIRTINRQALSFNFNDPTLQPQPVFQATLKPLMAAVNIKVSLTF